MNQTVPCIFKDVVCRKYIVRCCIVDESFIRFWVHDTSTWNKRRGLSRWIKRAVYHGGGYDKRGGGVAWDVSMNLKWNGPSIKYWSNMFSFSTITWLDFYHIFFWIMMGSGTACESGIAIFAWRFSLNYAYSPLICQIFKYNIQFGTLSNGAQKTTSFN